MHNVAAVYEGSLDETDREDIRERAAAADIQHPDGAASVRSCVTPFSGKAIRTETEYLSPLVAVCADTHVHPPLTQSRGERCAPRQTMRIREIGACTTSVSTGCTPRRRGTIGRAGRTTERRADYRERERERGRSVGAGVKSGDGGGSRGCSRGGGGGEGGSRKKGSVGEEGGKETGGLGATETKGRE